MGRPPCCDRVGIKKGPWTPEEDIILVSYIQEHGPGNWRSVPANTGLMRCSKSCRLRWTNYLRPGIKRGNFTPHEEGMIIHLQALLGNKWAAIASYLPQRTDNDIKNYWNTHLKKKLKKLGTATDSHEQLDSTTRHFLSTKSLNDRRSIDGITSYAQNSNTVNQNSTYASSTENISRLLEGWMRSSPKTSTTFLKESQEKGTGSNIENPAPAGSAQLYKPKAEKEGSDLISYDFGSILSFENSNNVAWDNKSTSDLDVKGSRTTANNIMPDKKQVSDNQPPLSFLEDWLLNESVGQVEDMMELSPVF